MKCKNAGGAAAVTLVAHSTGLPQKQVLSLFDDLENEGEACDNPTISDVFNWQERQEFLLSKSSLDAIRKDSLRTRLRAIDDEPVPSGATFYAWTNLEARARQQKVLNGIEDVVDIHPPGTHEHKYSLGEDGRPTHIWYTSYGSNLNRSRLMNYISGGRPEGSNRTYIGCDDRTPPVADIPIRMHGFQPFFSLNSSVWGGGIAFIDEAGDDASFLGRAYLVTVEQYDQIVAQENGNLVRNAAPVDVNSTIENGYHCGGNGSYDTSVHIGDYRGAPVITFTSPFSLDDAIGHTGTAHTRIGTSTASLNAPSAAYAKMIASGLQEAFPSLTDVERADYLRGCPGASRWARRDLIKTLRSPTPTPAVVTRPWATRRAVGDFYPPTKTYTSREEQTGGVRRWKKVAAKAAKDVSREEAQLASMEKTATKEDIKEQQTFVSDALKAAKEADRKYTAAAKQEPKEWFTARASRTRRQWEAFADDLHKDLKQAETTRDTANPKSGKHRRAQQRVAKLSAQWEEATSKAKPFIPSNHVTSSSYRGFTLDQEKGWVEAETTPATLTLADNFTVAENNN